MNGLKTSKSGFRSAIPLKRLAWNPYLVGLGIGVLSWLAFLLVDKPIGMSTEISKLSGWFIGFLTGPEFVSENPYWADTAPKFGYSTVFLLFTFVGAGISALSAGDFHTEAVPQVWRDFQGGSLFKRFLAAFLGGAILLFGARLAGGCTSGHGISGTLQLALSSWVFFPVMFITGMITSRILFRTRSSPSKS